MARKIRARELETRTARLKLPVAKKPVFVKLRPGLGLGYRRNRTNGTWVARYADGKGANATEAIGHADDYDEANGTTVLSYDQADQLARDKHRLRTGQPDTKPSTVAEALERYDANLRTRGRDAWNVRRVRFHLGDALGKKRVSALTSDELERWRDNLAAKLSAASANRICNALRAALNRSADHDASVTTRRAWQVGLKGIEGAHVANNVILDASIIHTIISKSYDQSQQFGLFVETAAVTGARPSELARVRVQDLQNGDAPRLIVPRSLKGRGEKKIPTRPVPISVGLAARLRVATANKKPTDLLLAKPSEQAWSKSDHARPFRRAAKAAGCDPAKVTIYALRHSSIVRQLLAGTPARVVAVNHDTSIGMIERTYSAHIADHADELGRRGLLETAPMATVLKLPAAG
jgi:integrase